MLQGKKVKIRPMEMGDIPLLDVLVRSGDVLHNLSTWLPINDSLAAQEASLGEKIKKGRSSEPHFAITTLDNTVIGSVGINRTDFRNSDAMVAIFVGADYTGRGYGTEAMRILIDFIFMEMNIQRVELNVFEFNERAISSYKKVGFIEEGRFRQELYRNGNYYDIVQMAVLKEDFIKI